MPHIKIYLRHNADDIAWLFLSSFNLSIAAWGNILKSGPNRGSIQIKSYEMGVLFLPSKLPTAAAACSGSFSCTDPSSSPAAAAASGASVAGVERAAERLRMTAGNHLGKREEELCSGVLALPVPFALPPSRLFFSSTAPPAVLAVTLCFLALK